MSIQNAIIIDYDLGYDIDKMINIYEEKARNCEFWINDKLDYEHEKEPYREELEKLNNDINTLKDLYNKIYNKK